MNNSMNVPFISNQYIENESLKLLKEYYSTDKLPLNESIPVFDIIEYLGYDIDFRKDGLYKDKNYLGGLIESEKTIEFNEHLVKQDGRLNFTAAHEIGHIRLHVPLMEKKIKPSEILCRKDEGFSGNKKQRIEIQADKFASYLLMPRSRVISAFKRVNWKPINVRRKNLLDFFRPISWKKKALNITDKVIDAGGFDNVSKLAMLNRLIGLKLINGLDYQSNRNNRRKESYYD